MAFQSLVLFLSFFAIASALTTPYAARNLPHHHRAIAARIVDPVPVVTPIVSPTALRTRQNSKRCKPRISSAVLSSTTQEQPKSTSVKLESPSPEPLVESTKAVDTPKPSPPPPKPTNAQLAPSHSPSPPPPPPPPPPPHTTTPKPAPSPTKASPAPAPGTPSYLIGTQTGDGTFYATGLGACGITNNDSQHIAAVSLLLFDSFPGYNGVNPNSNPLCGRTVTASYQGKSVEVTLTDRCTGCKIGDLDFSPSAFNVLADFGVGRIHGMTWTWN